MCSDYVASEATIVHTSIVWIGGFSQPLLVIALRDASDFMYEMMKLLRSYFRKKKIIKSITILDCRGRPS